MKIGVIGLGLVGGAIARRLLAAGHPVVGFDIEPDACRRAAGVGVEVVPDAREVAGGAAIVLLSLFDSTSRRELLFGGQALLGALAAGSILIDTSTGRPKDLVLDAEVLSGSGVRLVDAALSGSSEVIGEGRAIALVGDDVENAVDYGEVLRAFSKEQYYLGAPGRGLEAKLVVNLVFGLNRLVLAEALGLAGRAGLNPQIMLQILQSGETYSRVMDVKGPKMLAGSYEPPVARLGQHFKDVGLIREWGHGIGARLPATEVHAALLQELVEAGLGDLDNAAIFRAYDSRGS